MNIKTIYKFFAALICCFLFGCGVTLGLHLYDSFFDMPAKLTGGQTIDFSAYGFSLTVPETYALNDYTANHISEGGNALFAGCVYGGGEELYIYCYENAQGDHIDDYAHEQQALVTHYVSAGAGDVRLRTLGDRQFICYSVQIPVQSGFEKWNTYETWDDRFLLVFETRMRDWDVLSILQTIDFSADGSLD